MWAAQAGGYETIRVLLEKGADANLKNKEGKSALDYARDKEILHLLKAAVSKSKQKAI